MTLTEYEADLLVKAVQTQMRAINAHATAVCDLGFGHSHASNTLNDAVETYAKLLKRLEQTRKALARAYPAEPMEGHDDLSLLRR